MFQDLKVSLADPGEGSAAPWGSLEEGLDALNDPPWVAGRGRTDLSPF